MKMGSYLVLLLAVFLVACNSQPESAVTAKEVRQEVQKFLHGSKQSTPEQKEQYSRSIEEKLKTLSAEIEGIKEKTAILNGEVKNDLVAALITLENRTKTLQNRLVDLRAIASDQWELMRGEMEAALKDLEEASHYFAGRVPA